MYNSIHFYALVQTMYIIKLRLNSEYLVCTRLSEDFRKCSHVDIGFAQSTSSFSKHLQKSEKKDLEREKARSRPASVCLRVKRLEERQHQRVAMFILRIGLILVR
jgi:hypothetical protein